MRGFCCRCILSGFFSFFTLHGRICLTDRISLNYECDDVLAAALAEFEEMIARTTLATSIGRGAAPEGAAVQEWDINGKKATLAIAKA